VQDEIVKHKQELGRLHKTVASYQGKLEAIPVREQQIAELVRDYEISKAHYTSLLSNQLSAETATQLEVRQKGEKFTVLDPAQPAERPSKPNRLVLNSGGAVVGLGLGLLLAVVTEFLGTTITSAEQITATCGLPVLEVIPIIQTRADRRKQRIIMAVASGAVVTMLATVAILFYYSRGQMF
jgi:capsular polysaccharide biosynthesis protein